MTPRVFTPLVLFLVIGFLIGPFFIIVAASLSGGETLAFPPQGFSLQWVAKVFTVESFRESFASSSGLLISDWQALPPVTVGERAQMYGFRYLADGMGDELAPELVRGQGALILFDRGDSLGLVMVLSADDTAAARARHYAGLADARLMASTPGAALQ